MFQGEGESGPGLEAGQAVGPAGEAVPVQAEVPRGHEERPGRVSRSQGTWHRNSGAVKLSMYLAS